MTDDEVRNLFETVGSVQSCKIIRDKLTQVSLGYAFINYSNGEDSQRAIDNLNGLPLQGKTIKVSYARPSSSTIKNANLYVAHLPKAFTQAELEVHFAAYGNIITSKILIDSTTGLSRGVGFVRYDKHSEAESAISALNGTLLPGCQQPILVKFANQEKPSGGGGGGGGNGSNNNVTPPHPHPHQTVVAAALASGMAAMPGIAQMTRRGNPGFTPSGTGGPMRHSPLANVRFNPVSVNPGMSLAALAAIRGTGNMPPGHCIFVYNLPESAEDSLLYQLFGPFGAIMSVKVIKDSTGKCKRFGFVNMLVYEEAYSAILALNGYEVEGRALQVSFKKDWEMGRWQCEETMWMDGWTNGTKEHADFVALKNFTKSR